MTHIRDGSEKTGAEPHGVTNNTVPPASSNNGIPTVVVDGVGPDDVFGDVGDSNCADGGDGRRRRGGVSGPSLPSEGGDEGVVTETKIVGVTQDGIIRKRSFKVRACDICTESI